MILYFLNRRDEALDILKKYEIQYSDDIDFLREGAKYYWYLGEYESSRVLLNKLMVIFQDRPPIILWLNAVHETEEGNVGLANKYLEDLHNKYKNKESGSPAWFLALYYCTVEDYENTFEWLQKSYDRHEMDMVWLREEPLLIPIRNDSRYLELYSKVGFPMEPHSTLE